MSPLELVRLALSRLRRGRVRAALTMLGVIIGVASVVALVGVGQGTTTNITNGTFAFEVHSKLQNETDAAFVASATPVRLFVDKEGDVPSLPSMRLALERADPSWGSRLQDKVSRLCDRETVTARYAEILRDVLARRAAA